MDYVRSLLRGRGGRHVTSDLGHCHGGHTCHNVQNKYRIPTPTAHHIKPHFTLHHPSFLLAACVILPLFYLVTHPSYVRYCRVFSQFLKPQ